MKEEDRYLNKDTTKAGNKKEEGCRNNRGQDGARTEERIANAEFNSVLCIKRRGTEGGRERAREREGRREKGRERGLLRVKETCMCPLRMASGVPSSAFHTRSVCHGGIRQEKAAGCRRTSERSRR